MSSSDDTVLLLYGPEDAAGFRQWLAQRYQSPQALTCLGQCLLVDGGQFLRGGDCARGAVSETNRRPARTSAIFLRQPLRLLAPAGGYHPQAFAGALRHP